MNWRSGLFTLAALGGCALPTPIGTAEAPPGAADAGASRDAPRGALRDVPGDDGGSSPDAPHAGCEGFEPGGVVVGREASAAWEQFRVYYLGQDGALVVERRSADDGRRLCASSLGVPEATTALAARPAVAGAYPIVVMAARDEGGGVSLWTREESPESASECTGPWSDWSPLPRMPRAIAGAPTAHAVPVPVPQAIVTAVTDDGELMYTTRRVGSHEPWPAWTAVPHRPENVRVVGAAAILDWGDDLDVFVFAEAPGGRRLLFQTVYSVTEGVWTREWTDHLPPTDDPPCTSPAVYTQVSPETATKWIAVAGTSGRFWARRYYDVGAEIPLWGRWMDLGTGALGDAVATPVTPAFGILRAGVDTPDELLLVGVHRGVRQLQVARWIAEGDRFSPWSTAPDPLR